MESLLEEREDLTAEERADLEDLRQLHAEVESGPRFQLFRCGAKPVLVTAPHSIAVLRDGEVPHKVEARTAELAKAIAEELQGSWLTWTSSEQRRSELTVACSKRTGPTDLGRFLDPRNRDPNYLAEEEVHGNAWHQLVQEAAERFRSGGSVDACTLHVDVHGCRDPPANPSHLTVGLGAMKDRAHAGVTTDSLVNIVNIFANVLLQQLTIVVRKLFSSPIRMLKLTGSLVRVIVPDAESKEHSHFSGAWPESSRRLTQTQQAVKLAGFSHAVQLEMSKELRLALMQDRRAIRNFAVALRSAWERARAQ